MSRTNQKLKQYNVTANKLLLDTAEALKLAQADNATLRGERALMLEAYNHAVKTIVHKLEEVIGHGEGKKWCEEQGLKLIQQPDANINLVDLLTDYVIDNAD